MDNHTQTTEEYEAPTAVPAGSLVALAAGSYSEGESDDGDFSTVKWNPNAPKVAAGA
ncbi:hypothetical protein [Streptomyces carpaticus]|uniref:hypothetical protein n=1 Tax=Streptomyces carpaticus TaxID=285558 RepID=UPI0031F77E70